MAEITRPNGKPYRPRKLVAYAVTDEDEILSGAVVFGTHDPARARDLADELVSRDLGSEYVPVDPVAVWWRDGFDSGRHCWITDEEHGRAGVWFREVAERSSGRAVILADEDMITVSGTGPSGLDTWEF
jgi:hypothetical protein